MLVRMVVSEGACKNGSERRWLRVGVRAKKVLELREC